MIKLADTERHVQQPLDRAASAILTDRSLPFERASWQQCSCCAEWIQENELEYTFECVLGFSPSGSPTINFELKTRYPLYMCSTCRKRPPQGYLGHAMKGGGTQDAEGDSEQLCPPHVQAVYMLQGSSTADNISAISKGFIAHCPDCGLRSNLLQTQQDFEWYLHEHGSVHPMCSAFEYAERAGVYANPASFGGRSSSQPAAPEKVIKELLARLLVMTACHIVFQTRPPPTPIDQLSGTARAAAAATAELRSLGINGNSREGQQLMPYRPWAIEALSLDSDLLMEANWVRPSLSALALEHKPSLLDLMLAPPFISVAEHDAGMTADKLAVLLLREQQRQQYGTLAGLAASAAAGEQIPAAIAATGTALQNLLATDAVFQQVADDPEAKPPGITRVQRFLEMSGIPSINDIVYALAQPHVHGRSSRNLNLCAVCGMTPGALKRAKRPWALHRCKHCIVSTCQSCRQDQQSQQGLGPEDTDQLCLWCQGHPDTFGDDHTPTSMGRPAKQGSPFVSKAAASGVATLNGNGGVRGNTYGSGGQQQQGLLRRAAAAEHHSEADQDDEYSTDEAIYRPAQQYDLAVQLTAAAAAAKHLEDNETPAAHTEGAPEAKQQLQEELELLQQLQLELERMLGGQQPQQLPEQQQSQLSSKRMRPAADADCIDASVSKRQHAQQELVLPSRPATAAAQPSRCKSSPNSKVDANAGKRSRAPRVPRCGRCITCRKPSLKKGCVVNRKRLNEGKPFIVPAGAGTGQAHAADDASGVDSLAVDSLAVKQEYSSTEGSDLEYEPASPGAAAADGLLLLSAAGFHAANDPAGFAESAEVAPAGPAATLDHGSVLQPSPGHDQHLQHADAKVAVSASNGLKHKQQSTAVAADPVAAGTSAEQLAQLLRQLGYHTEQLGRDIRSYCAVMGTGSDQASKTLQAIQQLKQHLTDSYQQSGQQLFLTGLQILGKILASFHKLKLPASKVALASNLQLVVPGAFCPNSTACSVLDLLMCCWIQEVQQTGLTVEQPEAAAAGVDFTVTSSQQQLVAGLCQQTLDMVSQLSYIHMLYRGAQQAAGNAEPPAAVTAIQHTCLHLLSGAAVLLLHWPEAADYQAAWSSVAVEWRQCLQTWAGAVDYQNVVEAARDVEQQFGRLNALFVMAS